MDLLCVERLGGFDSRTAEIDPVIYSDIRVLNNLLSCEGYYIPKCNYFTQTQKDIQPFMRKVVTTWMLEVCEEQQCENQVFPLAVNYLDRFLCCCEISRNQLQLVAAVCLLLATKVKQCHPLNVETLCYYSDHSFIPEQMRKWELTILSTLQWDMSSITCYDYIDHVLERVPWSKTQPLIRTHALTLVSLCYTEPDFVRTSPALLGSSCILAAARGLKVLSATLDSIVRLTRCNEEEVEQYIAVIESLVSHETSTLRVSKPPVPSAQVTPPGKHCAAASGTPTDVQEVHF